MKNEGENPHKNNPVMVPDWDLDMSHVGITNKVRDELNLLCKRVVKDLQSTKDEEEKKKSVYKYYRRYYAMTLNKNYQQSGFHRSPTRDHFLDFPWKNGNIKRFDCLKIWEKICH